MRYRNTKTGVVVEVNSVIIGKEWEAEKPPVSPVAEKPKTTKKTTKKAEK